MRKSQIKLMFFAVFLVLMTQMPLFVFASEVDSDEWQKFGTSLGLTTVTITGILAREIWRYFTAPEEVLSRVRETGKEQKVGGILPVLDDTWTREDLEDVASSRRNRAAAAHSGDG
jgi:hypothetical protein